MTFAETCSVLSTIATGLSYIGVPYAVDAAEAFQLAPQIVSDYKEAIGIVEDFINGKPGASLQTAHVEALQAVISHPQWTSYSGQRGHNMHSAIPGVV